MQVYHHIRYAKAARFEEAELVPYEEPCSNPSTTTISCPQNKFRLDFIMGDSEPTTHDEDCHFLSIYTPSKEGKRPVLVWIHGGAYIAGSGEESAYDGSALAEEGDIVVVSISYRLGVFGYLYNTDGNTQNLGLKDQMTALRWVHQNISYYGGDPQKVTVAGQSAGGHSVASLITYCKEPLFRKAIIQSAPLGLGFNEKYHIKQYQEFLRLINKPIAEASTSDMLLSQKRLIELSGKAMSFSPYVPHIGKEISTPSLEKVLITWQKDDTSPFVAMKLKHENSYGRFIDRLVTRLSTSLVFKIGNKKYASFLRQKGIEVHLQELDWRPKESKFGACHCLELALLFGSWERWERVGMLGNIDYTEWKRRCQLLRKQWLAFIK